MSGLVGLSGRVMSGPDARRILQGLRDAITHHDCFARDDLFRTEHVGATRVHRNILQRQSQPYHDHESGIYIWLEGEFYNQDELTKLIAIPAKTDPTLLLGLYKEYPSFSFLKRVNGIFSAVIYDQNRLKVYLLNDRYGMRPLYWMLYQDNLVWASEVKAMTVLPGFSPRIDRVSLKRFLALGQLLEDRTWLEQVQSLATGTVLTWDIAQQSIKQQRYWWWDEIKPLSGIIDEEEAIEESGSIFINAVRQCSRIGERVGLLLSGGLDSRAILAALPQRNGPIQAITFGQKNCDDIRLAARATEVKGAVHHTVEINAENWLEARLEALWLTDGHLDIMNSHGIEVKTLSKDLFDIDVNGFAGDLILGGSYLNRESISRESHFDYRQAIADFLRCDPALLGDFDDYQGLEKTDFFFINNRVRRFTYEGLRHSLTEHRIPFLDNKLMEFVYSLPDKLRYRGGLYDRMLLRFFPDYFRDIAWQATGVPIGASARRKKLNTQLRRVRHKLIRTANKLGIPLVNRTEFHDYPSWIRNEPSRLFFTSVLGNDRALYPEYIRRGPVLDKWEKHLAGENHSVYLGRVISFEIWLQQLFNGRYKPQAKFNDLMI